MSDFIKYFEEQMTKLEQNDTSSLIKNSSGISLSAISSNNQDVDQALQRFIMDHCTSETPPIRFNISTAKIEDK